MRKKYFFRFFLFKNSKLLIILILKFSAIYEKSVKNLWSTSPETPELWFWVKLETVNILSQINLICFTQHYLSLVIQCRLLSTYSLLYSFNFFNWTCILENKNQLFKKQYQLFNSFNIYLSARKEKI